ncbi:hypothetical protein CTI12_AA096900 [Artemisia annua]|uniref:G1/S-specific cyclin-E protein n=1 Tax=Artemisia annua TaxID=35608 RepID=A0A2U1PYN1_ARTAN|nr:hypothetical protein CTI12_AA096900 [Artemisia annua]
MAKCSSDQYFFGLTSLQIGDLQSYLSDLSLFLAPDSKTFYVLVDNRPWLQKLVSRPAQLWQLMVTKSRMSPFAITRAQKGRKDDSQSSDLNYCPETPTPSENLRKWFSVIDAATLSRKRALLPVEKLRNSLLANSKVRRTLHGFIVFEVAWKDVRGINYLNELQTDTSLAIEAKYMRRWEFDSIAEAAKGIAAWFPGTLRERLLLEEQLDSMLGEVFHDAPNWHATDNDERISHVLFNHSIGEETEISEDEMSIIDSSPGSDDFYSEESQSESGASDCEEVDEATEYKDVLLLLRFNDHDLPFKLQNIVMSDLRLLTLLEAGLPSWVIFCQSYPVFCHIYRPWMCPFARVLYVAVSVVTVVIGFYDLYKNIPLLKATAARLCGPLFGWIETWEMVSRIKYLGTMLFLHNFKKAVEWFLMMTRTVRSFVSVLAQPLGRPLMVVLDVLLPVWNRYLQFIWILVATFWNLVENLIEIILFPVYLISSIVWMIATAILYPVFWLLWGLLYFPIGLILGLSNFVGFMFNHMYEFVGGIWLFVSGLFKLASNAETATSTYEVSMWRALWNDLFSQIFRAVRSILNGFVAFFTACNRHRLSIYNHVQELVRRLNQPTRRSRFLSSIQRANTSGGKTLVSYVRNPYIVLG